MKYQRHAENYRKSLFHEVTPFGLLLKKKAAINVISPDFGNLCNEILKEAERKLLRLLLKEMEQIYINTETEFDEAIQSTLPERYVQEKKLVQKRNRK